MALNASSVPKIPLRPLLLGSFLASWRSTLFTQMTQALTEDITTYLDRHQRKELLRFLTCGSVDDGKSTLIGRLLHDTKGIYEDQLAAVTRDSVKHGTTG